MVDGKLKTFMFLFIPHLFICMLWPLSTFNFDHTCLLLVGCIFGGDASFANMLCFDGRMNKELKNKRRHCLKERSLGDL